LKAGFLRGPNFECRWRDRCIAALAERIADDGIPVAAAAPSIMDTAANRAAAPEA
jgi:hypothetical protein